MLFIMTKLQSIDIDNINIDVIKILLKNGIPYIEVSTFSNFEDMKPAVISGNTALFIDGKSKGILLDVREYPVRGPQEPDLEKVTRGFRDGLVETIIFNTALIRRRLRDPDLIFELTTIGSQSKTDVAISYIDSVVDHDFLEQLKKTIR